MEGYCALVDMYRLRWGVASVSELEILVADLLLMEGNTSRYVWAKNKKKLRALPGISSTGQRPLELGGGETWRAGFWLSRVSLVSKSAHA